MGDDAHGPQHLRRAIDQEQEGHHTDQAGQRRHSGIELANRPFHLHPGPERKDQGDHKQADTRPDHLVAQKDRGNDLRCVLPPLQPERSPATI